MNFFITYYFHMASYIVIVFTLLICTTFSAQADEREYKVKAGFIYNFLKFTEWPFTVQDSGPQNIILCIIGEDPFGENIDVLKGKTVGGKTLIVKYSPTSTLLKNCQAVFIAESERSQIQSLIDSIKALPILTIGDSEGFRQKGVMINMELDQEKIRFDINIKSARRAGLRIDPRLLKLARTVQEQP